MRYATRTTFAALALGAAAALTLTAPAFSAGGGGGGSSGPIMDCPSGQTRDSNGKCKPTNSKIDDSARIAYGIAMAEAGHYEKAMEALLAVADKSDPRVLNYLGFSHRKAGHMDKGIAYYKQALAMNPDYTLAREYLGEAYLTMGRIDLAEEQLAEIEARCGNTCDTYFELADKIEDHRERQFRAG